MTSPLLTPEEHARYARHLHLGEVGLDGQQTLKQASVLCVGAGGLGSAALMHLSAAGVGRLGIVDHDRVELSNLQRQVIHGTSSVGLRKVDSAEARLQDINPHVNIERFGERIDAANALELIRPFDVVIDATNNFASRYLINDACVLLDKPLIYGSIFRFEGQASVFNHRGGPNYRDLYPNPPPADLIPSCAEAGVLGVLPGIIGCIQATEALKVLLDLDGTLTGRLLLFDALRMEFRELKLAPLPHRPPISALPETTPCSSRSVASASTEASENFARIDAATLKRRLDDGWAPFVLDVRQAFEVEIASLDFTDCVHPHDALDTVVDSLPRDRDIVVVCRSGKRSLAACETLRSAGFRTLFNLDGGIRAWAQTVDPSMQRY